MWNVKTTRARNNDQAASIMPSDRPQPGRLGCGELSLGPPILVRACFVDVTWGTPRRKTYVRSSCVASKILRGRSISQPACVYQHGERSGCSVTLISPVCYIVVLGRCVWEGKLLFGTTDCRRRFHFTGFPRSILPGLGDGGRGGRNKNGGGNSPDCAPTDPTETPAEPPLPSQCRTP